VALYWTEALNSENARTIKLKMTRVVIALRRTGAIAQAGRWLWVNFMVVGGCWLLEVVGCWRLSWVLCCVVVG
jgi:hypothetical protein